MAFLRQFSALLWKNWLIKKRAPCGSALELLIPLIFILIMIAIYGAFKTDSTPDSAYTTSADVKSLLPLSILPFRMMYENKRLAVIANRDDAGAVTGLNDFLAHMDTVHTEFNGSTVGGGRGFTHPALRALYIPRFSDIVVRFDSEADLEAHIQDRAYDKDAEADGAPKVWAALVFRKGGPAWDIALRFNQTEMPQTDSARVNTLQRGYNPTFVDLYLANKQTTNGPPFLRNAANDITGQNMPGFLSLQLAVDRWLINRSVPVSALDLTATMTAFANMISRCLPRAAAAAFPTEMMALNASNPAAAAAIAADVVQWMRSETYAPQQVDLVPFPVSAFTSNGFFSLAIGILAFFLVISYILPFSRLLRAIVAEKESKLREGMRMMGLGDAALVGSWLTFYFIGFGILALLVALITSKNIFKHSNLGMVFIVFWLFGVSTSCFCYLISVFFSKAKTAASIGILLVFASYFPFFSVSGGDVAIGPKTAGSLLSCTAFGLAINTMGAFEEAGVGSSAANGSVQINNWSVNRSLGMMLLDTLLYVLLAWYADAVLPASLREFGVPRPWYFPFTVAYWKYDVLGYPAPPSSPSSANATAASTSSAGGRSVFNCFRKKAVLTGAGGRLHNAPRADDSYLEAPDATLRAKEREGRFVGLKGLRKEFDTPDGLKVAVDDVDMTLYEGQIFVLLGHNGAGKTTTISMLTGLIPPTDGTATVFGRDISTQLTAIRKDLGVCPQHDVLWPELTVREHLQIFAAIKDVPKTGVKSEIERAIAEVGLTEKVNTQTKALSGGQRRKLSVTLALIGGSRVIFLDEPTSGMDPYSRRSTWQILQNAREGRVLLLTTHFMDEADILGDRICIMAQGTVRCCGSPMFLKERYGVGYVLTLIKAQHADVDSTVALIQKYAPAARVGSSAGGELSMRLPLGSSAAFPSMLAELDANMKGLGIISYGISITNIEDVFLKISEGDDAEHAVAAAAAAAAAGTGPESAAAAAAASSSASVSDAATMKIVTSDNAATTTTVVVNGRGSNGIAPAPASASDGSGKGSSSSGGVTIETVRASGRAEQTGIATFFRHFRALFLKRWQYSKRDSRAVCFQLLIPAILIALGLALVRTGRRSKYGDLELSTAYFNADARKSASTPVYPNYVPYFSFKAGGGVYSSDIDSVLAAMPSANVTTETRLTLDPAAAAAIPDTYGFHVSTREPQASWQRMSTFLLGDKGSYAASKYGAYVFTRAGTIIPPTVQDPTASIPNDDIVTYSVLHNTTAVHGAPTFVNLMNSALYAKASGNPSARIGIRSHPLPKTEREDTLFASLFVFTASIIIIIAFAFVSASNALFVVKEREVSAKHQQLISGVSLTAYWTANYAWDLLTFFVPAALAILLCFAFGIKEFTDTEESRLANLVGLFILYGVAGTPFVYLVSYLFRTPSAAQNFVFFVNVLSIIMIVASQLMSQIESTCKPDLILRYFYRLLPSFAFGNGLIQLSFLTQLPLIDRTCDIFSGTVKPFSEYQPYGASELRANGINLLFLGVESFVYLALVIAIEYVLSQPRLRMYFKRDPVVKDPVFVEDEDVVAERARCDAQSQGADGDKVRDIIVVDRLRKVYPGGKVAVKNLSYGIPAGQCFGFLGINGAGKSTTLEILSGDILPTAGTAKLAGYDILTQQQQVRRLLGYCPQYDALLDLLTVREHLQLYARIKGVPEELIDGVVKDKLSEFDLHPFANKKAGSLSGGNKRKLGVAIAMVGSPPLILLDEPSTGMDPVAKRFMWRYLNKVTSERKECAIILTTHSMEEVEALSTRLGIMVGGRLRALGSAQHLKTRFGQGYTVEMKMSEPSAAALSAVEGALLRALAPAGVDGGAPAPAPGAAAAAAAAVRLPGAQVKAACAALGNGERAKEISDSGTGWPVAAALQRSGNNTIPVPEFAAWWAAEDQVAGVVRYLQACFPGTVLRERQGATLRFNVPATGEPLGACFAKLEAARGRLGDSATALGVASYSLGQTSLEEIFNLFAAQQDEEKGVARGTALATTAHALE